MNFDRYIISFKPGSSGRFIKFILISLLTDSDADIQLSDVNDTHLNYPNTAFGTLVSREIMHRPIIYSNTDTIFDKYASVRVLATHAYPNIELLTAWDVKPGVILITVDPASKAEIQFNALLKNKRITKLDVKNDIRKFISSMFNVFNNSIDSDIVLSLKYSDIFTPTENSYLGLEQIEKFTGLVASDKVKQNYKKYVDGRNNLLEKHRSILNEVTSFFDKY
jgi:hypothetical protein